MSLCGLGRKTVASDDDILNFGESDVVGLDGLGDLPSDTTFDRRAYGAGNRFLESILANNFPTVGVATRVRRGWSGCDILESIANNIGNDERDRLGRMRHPRELAALELRQMAPQRVYFCNGCAAPQEQFGDSLLIRQCQTVNRIRQQRRTAAGNEKEKEIVRRRLVCDGCNPVAHLLLRQGRESDARLR